MFACKRKIAAKQDKKWSEDPKIVSEGKVKEYRLYQGVIVPIITVIDEDEKIG